MFVLLSFVFLISGANADWQADSETHFSKKDIPVMNAQMSVRKDAVRFDMKEPMSISVIVQMKTKKAFTLMHPAKIVMNADLKQYEKQIPACSTAEPDACYTKSGLKKTTHETIDGKDCIIYVGTMKGRKKDGSEDAEMKIWHPTGNAESPPLKTFVKTKKGDTVETYFKNIRVHSLPDSLFTVPKDYQRAGAMEDIMKSFKGFGT